MRDLKTDDPSLTFLTIGGSRAYGMSRPTSDVDLRGVFWPSARTLFGLNPATPVLSLSGDSLQPLVNSFVPKHLKDVPWDIVLYDVRKFVRLVATSPNVLETLFAPKDCVLWCDPNFTGIYTNRSALISGRLRQAFQGFANGQWALAAKETGPRCWKTQAHCLRVLAMGCEVLETAEVNVTRPEASFLLDVREGKVSQREILSRREALEDRLKTCNSVLPQEPDFTKMENLLVEALSARFNMDPAAP